MAQDGLQSLHLPLDHPAPSLAFAGRRSSPEPRGRVFRVSQVWGGCAALNFLPCFPMSFIIFPYVSHVFPCFSPGSSQVHVGYVADCCWMLLDFAGKCRHKTECPQPGGVSPSAAARGAKQRNDPMAPMAMKIQGTRKESKRYGKSMENISHRIHVWYIC